MTQRLHGRFFFGFRNSAFSERRTQEGGLQIQFRSCLKPAQSRWQVICLLFAAQRFATLGCFLYIHLLNDCPASLLGWGVFPSVPYKAHRLDAEPTGARNPQSYGVRLEHMLASMHLSFWTG